MKNVKEVTVGGLQILNHCFPNEFVFIAWVIELMSA